MKIIHIQKVVGYLVITNFVKYVLKIGLVIIKKNLVLYVEDKIMKNKFQKQMQNMRIILNLEIINYD